MADCEEEKKVGRPANLFIIRKLHTSPAECTELPLRIEIYVGQTVNPGLSFINDDTLEPASPKIASPVMPSVVIPGKADLYFANKFRKV